MSDEDYNKKMEGLQKYIPFLENMIIQLKDPNKKNREQQLNKMESLYAMITDKKKKLKVETLNKCEDVISKLYIKVNHKSIESDNETTRTISISPSFSDNSTASSIPSERVLNDKGDDYTSKREGERSLKSDEQKRNLSRGKTTEISKPPISLDDLKCLEVDVQEKINEAASLKELTEKRNKIATELMFENIKSMNKDKKHDSKKSRSKSDHNIKLDRDVRASSNERHSKKSKEPAVPKVPSKIVKEVTSGFASTLSDIDDKIKEVNRKREERSSGFGSTVSDIDDKIKEVNRKREERSSGFGSTLSDIDDKIKEVNRKREERSSGFGSTLSDMDDKIRELNRKREERSSGFASTLSDIDDKIREVNRKREERRNAYLKDEKNKTQVQKLKEQTEKEGNRTSESNNYNKDVKNLIKFEIKRLEDPRIKHLANPLKQEASKTNANNLKDSKTEHEVDTASLKRLAEKYSQKPRIADEVDKSITKSIEQSMKLSPQISPVIYRLSDPPPPPPASLVKCSQLEPQLPPFKPPLPTLTHNPVLRGSHPTARTHPQGPNILLSPRENFLSHPSPSPLMSPRETFASNTQLASPRDNFHANSSVPMSPRDNFHAHSSVPMSPRDNFHANSSVPMSPRDNFHGNSSVPMSPRDSFLSPRETVSISPRDNFVSEYVREEFNSRRPRVDQTSPIMSPNNVHVTPNMPQRYNQPFNNFNQMEPPRLDYYPQNICPSPQYNHIPPLLSADASHYQDQKPFQNVNPYGVVNREPYAPNDLRWRIGDNRHWERRDFKPRFGGPMTYREHREMRENSRDPRVVRDTRERDSKDVKDIRDPRLNREGSVNRENTVTKQTLDAAEKINRDPRLNRGRSSSREDSKFDRLYSRTNRNRSRSRSRSSTRTEVIEGDTFSSPLDSLYNSREEQKSGKGYGVQSFRIPKKKKDEKEKAKEPEVETSKETISQDEEGHDYSNKTIDISDNEEDSKTSVNCVDNKESVPVSTLIETKIKSDPNKNLNKEEIHNSSVCIDNDVLEVTSTTMDISSPVYKEEESQPSVSEEQTKSDVTDDKKAENISNSQDSKTSTKIEEPVKPPVTEQTILAQFFANLLGSQNKKEKKTALYSLISTFSDSFSPKELGKITKIIHAKEEDQDSSDEELSQKPSVSNTEEGNSQKEAVEEDKVTQEQNADDTADEKIIPKRKLRQRKTPSSVKQNIVEENIGEQNIGEQNTSEIEVDNDVSLSENVLSSENLLEKTGDQLDKESGVLVSVGERTKSRKRTATLGNKARKKARSELDKLHDDIQEMFIRDGVLTASGKRMCHMLKDDKFAMNSENVECNAEEIVTKPGKKPQPKNKNQNKKKTETELKTMKHIRVIIQKIPDTSVDESEASRRFTRSMTVTESDDESSISTGVSMSNRNSDIEDADSRSDKEDDNLSTGDSHKLKSSKRKRPRSNWAAGIIKKKKKKQNLDELTKLKLPEIEISPNESLLPTKELLLPTKELLLPTKEFWIDFSLQKKFYSCKLCNFQGRYITTHYKVEHPDSEVLSARFSPALADEAIADAQMNMEKYDKYQVVKSTKISYVCRFCKFTTTVLPTQFYDHLTTHTGEYRHVCTHCPVSFCTSKSFKAHVNSNHQGADDKPVVRKVFNDVIIFGYLCAECNYVQTNKQTIEQHIKKYHSGETPIHKINLSTIFDKQIEKFCEPKKSIEENSSSSTIVHNINDAEATENDMTSSELPSSDIAPWMKKYKSKPGPKPKKKVERRKSTSVALPSISEPLEVTKAPNIRRGINSDIDLDKILPVRSKRAAKEKAQEKLKEIMEMTDVPSKKKTDEKLTNDSSGANDISDKPTKDSSSLDDISDKPTKDSSSLDDISDKPTKESSCLNDISEKTAMDSSCSNDISDKPTDSQSTNNENISVNEKTNQKEEKVSPVKIKAEVIKKDLDMSMFTSKIDIKEEKDKPEQDRLSKIDDLNVTHENRTSLNFVDKVCDRINLSEISIKQEQPEEFIENVHHTVNESPNTMPVLEKIVFTSTPAPKINSEPITEQTIETPKSALGVSKKNDNSIINILEKLQGRSSDNHFSNNPFSDDDANDNEDPPPLIHVNELTELSPSIKVLEVCGLIKVIKTDQLSTFYCLVDLCSFSTENKDSFQKHCKENHLALDFKKSNVCETCGVEIISSSDGSLLENLFKHTITDHSDYIYSEEVNENRTSTAPKPQMIRLRKLSGDALSNNQNSEKEKPDESVICNTEKHVGVSETTIINARDIKTNEVENNPFPFKIAEVVSLAETPENPPPLTPINKPLQLVVKEAKLTSTELAKPRKSTKAISKFIKEVEKLYKCPQYYCLFSSDSGDELQQHVNTVCSRTADKDSMVPCVYCDLKTPWEHLVVHIDIRHANCKYACPYCLYRACLKSYVTLHQERVHPYQKFSVLTVNSNKTQKKFTITDAKLDPKMLCKPYRCIPGCNLEFLFENEFSDHVKEAHKNNFFTCGHESCTSRVTHAKLLQHWSMSHNVSVYQCGYCTSNSCEIKTMYHHLSNIHPNLYPEILFRFISPKMPHNVFNTPEAFTKIRKIVNITNTISDNTELKLKLPNSPSLLVSPPKSSPYADSNINSADANRSPALPTTSSLIPSKSSTPLTDPLDIDTLIEMPSPTALSDKKLQNIMIEESPSSKQKPSVEPMPETSLEQISFSGGTQGEKSRECDVDPLELGESVNSQNFGDSSEDENDKSKKKFGLLGYQLFRCAACEFSCSNLNDFKKHIAKSLLCKDKDNSNKPFVCVHCKKSFRNSNILCDHIQCHGILRYSCSLCGNKFPTFRQGRGHMKHRHNVNQTTQTVLNSTIASNGEEYIIKPKLLIADPPAKENISSEPSSPISTPEHVYNPGDINKIPMRSIFSSDLRCGTCSYTTKVRTNLIRHLQFHSQEISVPDTAPVNPVPCLGKNEKMFDKMVNLASSSHTSSMRMGGAKLDKKDDDKFPDFVPSSSRYTCCAKGCNYICPEEGNLRHHLIALHSEELKFTCVHCKMKLNHADADNIIKHLKLHGLQLYKCHYCDFVHNLKHKIDRHITEYHNDLALKVITLRCLESEPKDIEDEENAHPVSTPVSSKFSKPWRCCMCKSKTVTQDGIRNHVLEKHDIDSQFKCALCIYKSNDLITFPGHYKEHHSNQEVNIIQVYCKIEEENKDDKDTDVFDTTPLWQRDRPRVRHIRGILFDESTPVPTKSLKKATKGSAVTPTKKITQMESAVPVQPTPSLKSDTDELIEEINQLIKRDLDDDVIIIDDDEVRPQTITTYRRKTIDSPEFKKIDIDEHGNVESSKIDDDFSEHSLLDTFGSFGLPFLKQLKCPKCNKFKSKRISDFIFHMFKEKEINRYACKICSDVSVTYKYMYKHVLQHQQQFDINNIISLPKNPRLEIWLQNLIRMQCNIIVRSLAAPKEISPNSTPHKVLCRYCNKWYRSEQERNEHAIFHWKCIPFKCSECSFEAYTRTHMTLHITLPHGRGKTPFIIAAGPTVAGELQYSDFLHMKEAEEEKEKSKLTTSLNPPTKVNQTAIAQVLVPEVVRPDMIDESEQDGTVQGMVFLDESNDKVSVEVADDHHEPSDALDISDLLIVSKTDTNVPNDGDVFCCEYCPYMSHSEMQIRSHISGQHDHMHIKFKVLNRPQCESKKDDYVACTICNEVGSEITIREHHLDVHEGETFFIYRYICCCCQKRFTKFHGIRIHFNRRHPGVQLKCKDIFNKIHYFEPVKTKVSEPSIRKNVAPLSLSGSKKEWKHYKCSLCRYERDFTSNGIGNVRTHVRNHFKAYICGTCGIKLKSKTDGSFHYKKEHPNVEENIIHDEAIEALYVSTMATICKTAVSVPEPSARSVPSAVIKKHTARKSTSKPSTLPMEEFSFYGNTVEDVDLNKIMSSVEINGMHLDMSAERLGTLFNLHPSLILERCDAHVDESNEIVTIEL
ncbi:uncharacterized protein LOC114328441 [Diabrotica virgifera virgifera]|uniref:Uncharacterized protein LOC114328441 isoform X2 n=1 Tax=Diabrotica virgifera virgifera TaxID=50390 RepID=A0A6P7FJ97_DIAVI|nr:uncharacterized protein LOC114328441 [Diabrotica virgifera virgifera]XP_028133092.2 uncharacterized protein LOC114328441 [Diabrotica virgifera virgifera]